MESIDTTEETALVEDQMKDVPEEVQDFMASKLFDSIIDATQKALALTQEQKGLVRLLAYELLMKTIDEDGAYTFLTGHNVQAETAIKIIYIVDTEILVRAQNITEFFTDDSEVSEEDVQNYLKPQPITTIPTGLQSLADRLKNNATASVSTRKYGLEKGIIPDNLPISEDTIKSPEHIVPTAPYAPMPTPTPVSTTPAPVQVPALESIAEQLADMPHINEPKPIDEMPIAHTRAFDPYHESIDK